MNKVSSIRWQNETLYHNTRSYLKATDQKMNTLIMKAIAAYLDQHHPSVSKLSAQTKAFSESDPTIHDWAQNQDTEGWEA